MTPITWLVKNLLTNKQVLVVEKSVDVLEVDSRSLILRVRITLECTLDCYRSLSFKFWATPYQNVKQKCHFSPKIDDETEIFDIKWAKNEHFCPKMTKNLKYINLALGRRFWQIYQTRSVGYFRFKIVENFQIFDRKYEFWEFQRCFTKF